MVSQLALLKLTEVWNIVSTSAGTELLSVLDFLREQQLIQMLHLLSLVMFLQETENSLPKSHEHDMIYES